mgnify:CR=1 FL=1
MSEKEDVKITITKGVLGLKVDTNLDVLETGYILQQALGAISREIQRQFQIQSSKTIKLH